ncbi:methionyl-tRNA formyltransferase [Zobellella aerophila]|uniref:Methionyl-tRNA formyltransferase n=1 Tax=Zobellella aerophila TaxID=870480 RepID=A0ABP6VGN6_9GAMM
MNSDVRQDEAVKVVFFSSSLLALPAILHLHDQGRLAAVVLTPRPDGEFALFEQQLQQAGIARLPLLPDQPDGCVAAVRDLGADLGLICAFRHRLPEALRAAPAWGCYNIHPSHLPAYRGAQPLYWLIREGHRHSQYSVMRVEEGMDTGPVLLQEPFEIGPYDTLNALLGRMAAWLPQLAERVVEQLVATGGQPPLRPQAGEDASLAPLPTPAQLRVDWRRQEATEIADMVRAGNPQYGSLLRMAANQVQLLQATALREDNYGIKPGTILSIDQASGLKVATRDGVLRLDILMNNDGVFDGYRFAMQAGLSVAMCFDS